jgi:hypothetical protein
MAGSPNNLPLTRPHNAGHWWGEWLTWGFVVVVGGGWLLRCRGGLGGWCIRFGTVARAATAVFGGATLARRIPIPLCPEDGHIMRDH